MKGQINDNERTTSGVTSTLNQQCPSLHRRANVLRLPASLARPCPATRSRQRWRRLRSGSGGRETGSAPLFFVSLHYVLTEQR